MYDFSQKYIAIENSPKNSQLYVSFVLANTVVLYLLQMQSQPVRARRDVSRSHTCIDAGTCVF